MSQSNFNSTSKAQLIGRILGKKAQAAASGLGVAAANLGRSAGITTSVPEAFTRFDRHPGYEKMLVPKAAAERFGLANPFFISHDGLSGATAQIGGKSYINFSSYNYLGLNGHPQVNQAAKEAIDHYGTTVSASRLVAGERPIQRQLEQALAQVYGVEDCVVFVSGHATNVSTIGYLFGPKDLVLHDALAHNSIIEGIKLSGATRRPFAHNDHAQLDQILSEIRGQFERVLIVIEGHYSMDGDTPHLPAFIDIKRRHQAFLMVDEAHSLGILGSTGLGLHQHYGVAGTDVDIWMGTLSKTLSGCGGYIAGQSALVEHLKYAAPGFVYSVGIAPSLAAASVQCLQLMQQEPERVQRLRSMTQYFLSTAKKAGLDTGLSEGHCIVPVIVGSSLKAAQLSNALFEQGINVQPIIHPAVEEKAARLRFFLSCEHTPEQIDRSIAAIAAF